MINFKNKNFRRFLFYLGGFIFIISLIFFEEIPFSMFWGFIGVLLMCGLPVNNIKRHKVIK